MTEEWRAIAGYGELYEVSSLGRVRRIKPYNNTNPDGILKRGFHTRGYPVVSLSRDGLAIGFRVHTLVAEAFIGQRPTGMGVNHIDGDKNNAAVDNLEYVSQLENNLHAIRTGLNQHIRGSANKSAKLNEESVLDIKRQLAASVPRKLLAATYSVSVDLIDRIARGKQWKHVVIA